MACQYLHEEKILLATKIAQHIEKTFGVKGRVHFNVGGAQAVEDALKLVRKHTGRSRMFAFEGGYHGRTLAASAITSSYRYRESYGEFGDRAEFVPYPYVFRSPFSGNPAGAEDYFIAQFERKFEHEYTGAWNPKTRHAEFGAFFIEAVQGTGGYIIPPRNYFKRLAKICRDHGILVVDDEIQMGFFRTGKMWALEHFDVQPDILVFGKALTNQSLKKKGRKPVGFLNPALYSLAAQRQSASSFHDVTTGSNLVHPATKGYDLATGLGTPDAWILARNLDAYQGHGGGR